MPPPLPFNTSIKMQVILHTHKTAEPFLTPPLLFYLTIPAKCSACGKITVEVQGQLTELDAMTESEEPIKTGTKVKVVKTDETTVYVERIY